MTNAREAAEAMREAAAKLCTGKAFNAPGDTISLALSLAADAIRKLPLPSDPVPSPREGMQDEAREWIALTDDDRIDVMKSLPDAIDGFLKGWGWLHFAKAIEARCAALNKRDGG